MKRSSGVVAALASAVTMSAAVMSAAPTGTQAVGPPEPLTRAAGAQGLPREIPRGAELTLADGDSFRVWAARDHRTVWGKRRDAATGDWGERRVVLRERNLFCGQVDARTAGGAVALTAECDENSYAEDQAPTASRALHSADTITWTSRRLEGEAHEEPGISPSGTHAVWPQSGGHLTWSSTSGFEAHRVATPGQEYTETAVITDSGRVSVLYGAHLDSTGECGLVVLTHGGGAAEQRQELALDHACGDSGLVNVDARTVLFGELSSTADVATVTRPDDASPWAVTRIAPVSAPGLRDYRGRGHFGPAFYAAVGLPLVAIGSSDGRAVEAQVFDEVAQSWAPATVVARMPRRCGRPDDWRAEPLGVVVAALACRGADRVVATTDGSTWVTLVNGRHPLGVSPDGSVVAVPGERRTTILSRERGAVRLPGGSDEACDIVVPDGPAAAVRLTSSRTSNGWPRVLQRSTRRGWQRFDTVRLPDAGTCRRARVELFSTPYTHTVSGGWKGYSLRLVRRGGAWQVVRQRPH